MELNTPQDYIEIAKRRKWWIIIPFLLVMIGSSVAYKELPKTYRATTLILVEPQKIPPRYIQSTVTLSVSDRLTTIKQQILSRTYLKKIITQLNLIQNLSDSALIEKKVDSMRKAITIKVRGAGSTRMSSFEISFDDRSPVDAARILNKIASLFMSENLRVREQQASDTSEFLGKELSEVEKKLKEKEQAIRRFKERYMGELPAQLDANLRIIGRLQQQLQTNNNSIIAAQQRKADLESQIDQIKATEISVIADQGGGVQDPLLTQLDGRRRQLHELLNQFTDQHPDVIAVKNTIQKLEAQIQGRKVQSNQPISETTSILDPTLNRLSDELEEVIKQIDRLRTEQEHLKDRIELYQQRVENIPKREQEMSGLLRDYGLLQENYRSLLDRKIQAQLAENLEKRQQGEQFKILDPATPPLHPFKPNRMKFFGLAFVLAFGLGGGLAFLREQMDHSFHKEDEVEQFTGFPVIAAIPRIENRKNGKKLTQQQQVRRHFDKQEHGGKQISPN